jgi:predicted DNA-binding ribbon-helix-helix protein
MKSLVIKRSIVIGGHKTSVSLEDAFWRGLKEIARTQQVTLSTIVSQIDTRRSQGNLSSAIRLFVLDSASSRLAGLARSHDTADTLSSGAMQDSTEPLRSHG